jgi:uroporphyrinogen decarboxylase
MTELGKVLKGKVVSPAPVWLMRQAGRYLPEYRALRSRTGSFWTMCMTPELAAEVTLQPIRRFAFDAAIIFSDILVVPYALGREVVFEESVGPSLAPVRSVDELDREDAHWPDKLAPVYAAIRSVRAALAPQVALLGFAGAPWTLATYMAEGRGSQDQRAAKLWGYRAPDEFTQLLFLLERCVAAHLVAQLRAGATAVQIFDSWASGLPARQFADWVIGPTRRVVDAVRKEVPEAEIIGFPRGATLEGYRLYAEKTGVSAVSVDSAVPMTWASENLGQHVVVQGNLDPLALVAGGVALDTAVDDIVVAMDGRPFIFNLGHGIVPETPVEHVTQMLQRVRRAR